MPFLAASCLSFLVLLASIERKPEGLKYIESIEDLSPSEIDPGIVALNLSKEFFPDLDVDAYSEKIGQLAMRVRELVGESEAPLIRIKALNTVLFLEERYQYDTEALIEDTNEALFINNLMTTKLGNCFSLPILYMSVAKRLGYPIYPVLAPGHVYMRYVGGNEAYNIEATDEGFSPIDEFYEYYFGVKKRPPHEGGYLRQVDYWQFLGCMFRQSAAVHANNGDLETSVAYLEKAKSFDPFSPNVHSSLATQYALLSILSEGEKAFHYMIKSEVFEEEAERLGYVDLLDTKAWKNIEEAYAEWKKS